jgi:hypothetical protein
MAVLFLVSLPVLHAPLRRDVREHLSSQIVMCNHHKSGRCHLNPCRFLHGEYREPAVDDLRLLLSAVCCLLSAVCCLLSAVCCLLSAICCKTTISCVSVTINYFPLYFSSDSCKSHVFLMTHITCEIYPHVKCYF